MTQAWFKYDNEEKIISSARFPKNLREAFNKSILKWELVNKGWTPHGEMETCGLCNMYNNRHCTGCPIAIEYGGCDNGFFAPYLWYFCARRDEGEKDYASETMIYFLKKLKKQYVK